jgi:hypothetical protein
MLTVQSKARIFDATNTQRERFTRWAVAITSKALIKQLKPFLASKVYTVANVKKTIKPKEIAILLEDIYSRVGLRFAKATYNGLLKQKAEFDEAAFDAIISDYLEEVGAENVVGITQTTQNILVRIVEDGIEQGLSVQEMSRSIRDKVAPLYKNRALTIARTETISASNFGSISGARMTGLDLIKEWIPALDDRTRTDHSQMMGKKKPLDKPFTVGGDLMDYPLDGSMGASAKQIVNCRCSIGYAKK